MEKKVRVRYAPSPTGYLHIGGARTALVNFLFAKKYDGDYILRIDDTDIERNVEGGENSQIDNLNWLGIIADESPQKPNPKYGFYRQSQRLENYQKYAKKLIDNDKAYFCYCTSQELEAERHSQIEAKQPPRYSGKCASGEYKSDITPAIRIRVPKEQKFTWNDIVRGEISIQGKEFGDWVIMKNNKMPTYNFACVIDDYEMEISHIFRGEEHISNTPKQIHLFEAFGWKTPLFGHLSLIVNKKGKKLSKRDESIIQFIEQYKNDGYIPHSLFNFLALLGWSPIGEKEIYSITEFKEMFDEKRLSKSPSFFDTIKLEWFNSQYIKKLNDEIYLKLVKPFAKDKYPKENFDSQQKQDILLLYKDEIKAGFEIKDKIKIFFQAHKLDKEAKKFLDQNPKALKVIEVFKDKIKSATWSINSIANVINLVKKQTGAKGKDLFMPIRIATTGQTHGPDIKSTIYYMGEDKIKNL